MRQQIADERAAHDFTRKLYESELSRWLEENKRLQAECERLRLALGQPSRSAEPPETPQAPIDPDGPPVFSGTTWQKVQQREVWMRSDAGKRWMLKTLGSVKPVESGESKIEETH